MKRAADISVSVIIPTYNRARCVGEAIDSVLVQEPPADEVIVVDDGSTDATSAVLAAYGDRITVIRQDNAGAAAARNTGLAHACGDWIAFLDSDDLWLPGRMARLHRDLGAGENEDIVLHVADLRMTGEGYDERLFNLRGWEIPAGETETVSDPFARAMSGVSPCSSAVRREIAEKVGGFPASFPVGEDIYFFSAVALAGPALFSGGVAAEARRIAGDEVAAVDLFRREPVRAYALSQQRFELLRRLPMNGRHETLLRRHMSGNLFSLARAEAEAGIAGHRRHLLRMVREHPSKARAVVKAIPPFLLGRRGYRLVPGNRSRFSRVR